MQMTEDEIRRRYNEARYKNKQINILTELNACPREDIAGILGVELKPERKPRAKKPKNTTPKANGIHVIKKAEYEAQQKAEAAFTVSRAVADELMEHVDAIEERINRLYKERQEYDESIAREKKLYEEFLNYVKSLKVKED